MTNQTKCIADLADCAREIAKDDPTILSGDYNAFERVMWTDNSGLSYWEMDREEYADAMRAAWDQVRINA